MQVSDRRCVCVCVHAFACILLAFLFVSCTLLHASPCAGGHVRWGPPLLLVVGVRAGVRQVIVCADGALLSHLLALLCMPLALFCSLDALTHLCSGPVVVVNVQLKLVSFFFIPLSSNISTDFGVIFIFLPLKNLTSQSALSDVFFVRYICVIFVNILPPGPHLVCVCVRCLLSVLCDAHCFRCHCFRTLHLYSSSSSHICTTALRSWSA